MGKSNSKRKGVEMSVDKPTKTNETEPSPSSPTGYRVSLIPGGLEVSARLGTVEEISNLVRLLRAGTVFIEQTTDGDMDQPLNLSKRLEVSAA